jgi:NAD(P)H-hydrate epimerase
MIVVTAAEMREIDRLTMEKHGIPGLRLMERAGKAAAEAVVKRYGKMAKKGVLVVAGKGNNGGDGLVAARYLRKQGLPCTVALLARRDDLSPDAANNLRALLKLKGKIVELGDDEAAGRLLKSGKVLVDAIFGTGLKEEVRGAYGRVIDMMNGAGSPIVAIDIPSGLDADRGWPLGHAVRADVTVALGYAKVGEIIYPGVDYVGELIVADIGIPRQAIEEVRPRTELIDENNIAALVPRRSADSHKGTYGHLVVLAGSRGKSGAAILACRAAMRAGAGLVTLAAARSLNDIFASSMAEMMTHPLRDQADDDFEPLMDEDWRRLLERKNVLLFGPGIGLKDSARDALRWLLKNLDLPWVIDADGLTLLAQELDRLRSARRPPVLTPHPGEMARLAGLEVSRVQRDRVGIARAFAREHRCFVVLKGARTVLAAPNGDVRVNPTGNPGMASGGMGDVLAGILGGLLAQGLSVEAAMELGVFIHGFAADRLVEERGPFGLIASDVIENLPQTFRLLARSA